MIERMKRVTLLAAGTRVRTTTNRLAKLGVMHINPQDLREDAAPELDRRRKLCHRALQLLDEMATSKKVPAADSGQPSRNCAGGESVANTIVAHRQHFDHLLDEQTKLQQDQDRAAPWGAFSLSDIETLAERGMDMTFYALPKPRYRRLTPSVRERLFVFGRAFGIVYCAHVRLPGMKPPAAEAPELTTFRVDPPPLAALHSASS